jgi:outer membrane protein OmpA-like peptidoglycan-associated protein
MGHTDSTGSDAYNEDLSKRRADAVADYLALRGVSRARIATIGYGERYPVADNATDEGRARNRRVEIKITPVTQDEVNAARGN